MQRILLALCCVLIALTANEISAQNTAIADVDKEVICQVLDLSDKLPIVFATVSIKDKNNGVIADEDGYFRLPYKYKTQNDVLIISSIGYESKTSIIPSFKLKYLLCSN